MSRVTHFEIHADDPERAADFYSRCLGWEITRWDGAFDYWLVRTGPDSEPGINGAIMKRTGTVHQGMAVIGFVCTVQLSQSVDLERVVERAVSLGGSVALAKHAVPGVGWQAFVKDTEGNIVGLHKSDPGAH